MVATLILASLIIIGSISFGVGYLTNLTTSTTTPSQISQLKSKSIVSEDLKIKGNRKSMIYHLPGCPNYYQISDYNIVWFRTHEEAKAAGYRMTRNC